LRRPLINAGAEPGDIAILEFDVSKHMNLTLGGEELADMWACPRQTRSTKMRLILK
jgi:hypothetical protein